MRGTKWLVCALLLLAVITVAGAPNRATRAFQSASAQQTAAGVGPLLQSVFRFWVLHGPDKQYGGFHGTLDRQGNPIAPTDKTIVQQARHLWAFSTLLMSKPETWGFKAQELRASADSLYKFMKDNMMTDSAAGGRLFKQSVTRAGQPVQGQVNAYSNMFAIYSLSAYARATGSAEARSLALNTFKAFDALFHSPLGGYDESVSALVFDSIPLSPRPSSTLRTANSSSKVVAEAAAKAQPRLSQSFNTLLHAAEALTELFKAVGGSNPAVTARLFEVVQLQTGPMVVRPGKQGPNTPAAYIAPNYDPRDWTPVGPVEVNYGHNIEAAWLLADAVDELEAKGAVNKAKAAAMRSALQDIGVAAVAAGYDTQHGGMYDASLLGAARPTSPNKVWWAQAEALLGLEWLHRRTGNAAYKQKLQQTLAFIRSHLWDQQYGEWYWQTGPAGGAPLAYSLDDAAMSATVKGNAWKASYHNGRALLRLAQAGY